MRPELANKIYKELKYNQVKFDADIHCPIVLEVMGDPNRGRLSSVCVELNISAHKFYRWMDENPILADCYSLGKMYAMENWEKEGEALREIPYDELGCRFEHWRMIGWTRFGVGKNSRIRLSLNPKDTPDKHYNQLLQAASRGEYTAGEIKQLMEAVNVGLKADENFRLQKEVDAIKSDLDKMEMAKHGKSSIPTQSASQKNQDTVERGLC